MSNVEKVNLGSRAFGLKAGPALDGYSKVVIQVTDELEFVAGTDTGRTLTLVNPWGTQEMADNILSKIRGYAYQPFESNGARLDPAAELGDGVTVKNIYSGLYSQSMKFSRVCLSDISAPGDKEIDHEYPYVPSSERRITRKLNGFASDFKVNADDISAKVSKIDGTADFGWNLSVNSWVVSSKGATILRATKDGLEVKGKIIATSGKIGGFDILSNRLSYNNLNWNGTNSTGIYIGPSGIQAGPKSTGVQITPQGKIYASDGYFRGSVRANKIDYGGDAGYFPGGGIGGHSVGWSQLGYGSVNTSITTGGINTSLGYADFANSVFRGSQKASFLWGGTVIAADVLQFQQKKLSLGTIDYKNHDGVDMRAQVVKWI